MRTSLDGNLPGSPGISASTLVQQDARKVREISIEMSFEECFGRRFHGFGGANFET